MFPVLVLASFALFTYVFVVCALFGWLLRKNISKRKKVRMSATAKVIAYSCFTASHPIWRLSVVGVMVGPQTATRLEIFQQNGIGIPSVNSINSTVIVLYSISRTTNLDSAPTSPFSDTCDAALYKKYLAEHPPSLFRNTYIKLLIQTATVVLSFIPGI